MFERTQEGIVIEALKVSRVLIVPTEVAKPSPVFALLQLRSLTMPRRWAKLTSFAP